MLMKLQNAMEFLVTYSWAILILVLIIAGLYFLGIFSPQTSLSQQCLFPSTFSCLNYQLFSNGSVFINIQQLSLDTIVVTSLSCSANSTASNVIVPSNQIVLSSGKNFTYTLPCYGSNGALFASSVGTVFKGYIQLNYTDVQSQLPSISKGRLIAIVSK